MIFVWQIHANIIRVTFSLKVISFSSNYSLSPSPTPEREYLPFQETYSEKKVDN